MPKDKNLNFCGWTLIRSSVGNSLGNNSKSCNQGSVLIVCLWALVFLGALTVSVGTRAASCIRLAEHVKITSSIDNLAGAGVERAIAAIRSGNEEVLAGAESEYWSRDNDVFDGGEFSVFHIIEQDGNSVTNYGVISESARTNINNHAHITSLLESLSDRVSASDLSESIRQYRLNKKTLTKGRSEGKFESIYELLLVEGMSSEVLAAMEPHITVFGKNCYRGISRARLIYDSSSEDRPVAEGHVEFVFNAKSKKIVLWNQ